MSCDKNENHLRKKTYKCMNDNFRLEDESVCITSFLKAINFFPECTTPLDCPAGGTNYICNNNKCNCPIPMVLDGDKCVGKFPKAKA